MSPILLRVLGYFLAALAGQPRTLYHAAMDAQRLDRELAVMPPLLRALLRERFVASPLAYHNAEHVAHMLDGLDRWFAPDLGERAMRVLRYAIWLHDAFYDASVADNERRSADIGMALLTWPEDELRDLEACIMATKGHATDHALAQMLVDLDLMILAEDRDRYRAYALAIRDEYRCYSDEAYRSGRIKVLDHICAVPLLRRLSRTQGLADDALELRARANMRWEQERLRGGGSVEDSLGS